MELSGSREVSAEPVAVGDIMVRGKCLVWI
jgi:hypothetical protein